VGEGGKFRKGIERISNKYNTNNSPILVQSLFFPSHSNRSVFRQNAIPKTREMKNQNTRSFTILSSLLFSLFGLIGLANSQEICVTANCSGSIYNERRYQRINLSIYGDYSYEGYNGTFYGQIRSNSRTRPRRASLAGSYPVLLSLNIQGDYIDSYSFPATAFISSSGRVISIPDITYFTLNRPIKIRRLGRQNLSGSGVYCEELIW
jgi:hypothetical protein